MSRIDKFDYVKGPLISRMIIRRRQLYLRDYNPIKDTVKLSIAMFSMLKNLLELEVTIDGNGYVSVMFNLDAWDNYRAGKFTGKEAAKKGWRNLINHVPTNSIMISIDKYPKSSNAEIEPDEIQNRIKARIFFWTTMIKCVYPPLISRLIPGITKKSSLKLRIGLNIRLGCIKSLYHQSHVKVFYHWIHHQIFSKNIVNF